MRALSIRFVFALLFVAAYAGTAIAKDTWRKVDRIVAIGDIHGDYDQYRAVMRMTGLLDESGAWIGGKTHLVQTGDIPDRGPDSFKILLELKQLQPRARKAGGYIHLLLGNHEAMNINGDLRYVHPGEYAAFVSPASESLRDQYYQRVLEKLQESGNSVDRDLWYKQHPLGYVEHRQAWQPRGSLARWISTHNTVIRINDILFVHGGLNPHLRQYRINQINRQVRAELKTPSLAADSIVSGKNSPLWYRGYVNNPADTELEPLAKMLEYHSASHIVVGHSPSGGRINSRFDGRVVFIDVGLSKHYGSAMAALRIENDRWFAVHRGESIPLALRDEDLPAYYRQIEAIDTRHKPPQ
jgi:hypothetical protein